MRVLVGPGKGVVLYSVRLCGSEWGRMEGGADNGVGVRVGRGASCCQFWQTPCTFRRLARLFHGFAMFAKRVPVLLPHQGPPWPALESLYPSMWVPSVLVLLALFVLLVLLALPPSLTVRWPGRFRFRFRLGVLFKAASAVFPFRGLLQEVFLSLAAVP